MQRISSKSFLDSHANLSESTSYNDPACDNLAPKHDLCDREITADRALKNISNILFEEKEGENDDVYPEVSLQAIEKSFYDILGHNIPSSHGKLPQPSWKHGYATSTVPFSDLNHDINSPIVEFNKGLKEGLKFLPSTFDLQGNNKLLFPSISKEEGNLVEKKIREGKEDRDLKILRNKRHANSKDLSLLKGKRHVNYEDLFLTEARKCKIPVLYFNSRDDEFDKVLFFREELHSKEARPLREIKQTEMKLHHKEINENFVDLRILLIHCAQAISINDIKYANQLIRQIRRHSSPDGNGDQRMAQIFVNALDARLNGYDVEPYQQLVMSQVNMIDNLNTFNISLTSNPFLFVSQYFANHTILNATRKASKLHIIHFGIQFGFNWPCLIHALSQRFGGPPKLRITGIDSSAPGFSPIARLEETGKRLECYTRVFGVPFEYRGIGAKSKSHEICIEDLNIEKDEVVIVNCLRGLEFLGDETDVMYSPKNRLLDIVKQIKPNVFIQGIINGSYSGSVFPDRFKQVLLHHSAIFDMLDNNIPLGNNKQRWYLENFAMGRVAINVIACEGSKRFIRPETYKQWHARNLRAEYSQLPLDRAIIKQIKDKASKAYNKDFFVQDDNEWLLWGWKGRVIAAISTWQPR